LSDDVFLEELLVVLIGQSGGIGLCARRVHSGLRLPHGGLISLTVKDEHHLAGAHRLAFVYKHFGDES